MANAQSTIPREEPRTDELPPLVKELRQMLFRAFTEQNNRQFEEDQKL